MTRETQTLTVLFADITESSRLYQQLGDEAARSEINACLSCLSEVLPRFHGKVVKTLGDAIMCVFPDEDAAVLAACEMQSISAGGQAGSRPLRIHIGLHRGPVLVEDNDVFGDTVNAAAFLTNVAMADQILLSDVTERELSSVLKSSVRPLFHAALKGSSGESAIYQILWRADNLELTDVNLLSPRTMSTDSGGLLVALHSERVRVDHWRPSVIVGRAADCDLVVNDQFASRRHLSIRLARNNFYLMDQSVNGTYIALESGEEIHLLRGELVLEGSGEIRLGRSRMDQPTEVLTFRRDRRSQFRT